MELGRSGPQGDDAYVGLRTQRDGVSEGWTGREIGKKIGNRSSELRTKSLMTFQSEGKRKASNSRGKPISYISRGSHLSVLHIFYGPDQE